MHKALEFTRSIVLCSTILMGSAVAQSPALARNTWTSGAPLPVPVFGPATAVLKGQIYLVGGYSPLGPENITQIYNPTTDAWTSGVMFPTTVNQAGTAVVKNILCLTKISNGQLQYAAFQQARPVSQVGWGVA